MDLAPTTLAVNRPRLFSERTYPPNGSTSALSKRQVFSDRHSRTLTSTSNLSWGKLLPHFISCRTFPEIDLVSPSPPCWALACSSSRQFDFKLRASDCMCSMTLLRPQAEYQNFHLQSCGPGSVLRNLTTSTRKKPESRSWRRQFICGPTALSAGRDCN